MSEVHEPTTRVSEPKTQNHAHNLHITSVLAKKDIYHHLLLLVFTTSILLLLGRACSSCSSNSYSPFNNLLPQGTPFFVEGSPSEVVKLLNNMDITEPSLGEGQSLSDLQCERLLYAIVVPDSDVNASSCKQTLMSIVNTIEDQWSVQQRYPESLPVQQLCSHDGQYAYQSDGKSFTLSCIGAKHRIVYNSTDGLDDRYADISPLIFIAFLSDDPRWNDVASPAKHPNIKILASDIDSTISLLDNATETISISYDKETSLYAKILSKKLKAIWKVLPLSLPGTYTTITRNEKTGIYSIRALLDQEKGESAIDIPDISETFKRLPQTRTRIATSTTLAKKLNILPNALRSSQELALQSFGFATDQEINMNKLLPTIDSSYSGLSQATIVENYPNEETAEQRIRTSPWGDLSANNDNPQCLGQRQGKFITVSIGDRMERTSEEISLPQGPGPCQIGGDISLGDDERGRTRYIFSGGVHNNELWLEIMPLEAHIAQ